MEDNWLGGIIISVLALIAVIMIIAALTGIAKTGDALRDIASNGVTVTIVYQEEKDD
jgi:hypothetical protein